MLTRCQCSQDVLTRRAHTRRTQNATRRRPRCRCAPTSLRLRSTGSFPFSTRSSRLPRCRGRALARLPPAPQLRGPRSTTSPRSRPGKLVELDAFCVPSSPRGRCHSQKRGALLRPSGSVIAAGCRGLPQRERRRSEGASSGEAEKTSASEEIFERHGWNKVKSGYRVGCWASDVKYHGSPGAGGSGTPGDSQCMSDPGRSFVFLFV